jgi:hypothetical protein
MTVLEFLDCHRQPQGAPVADPGHRPRQVADARFGFPEHHRCRVRVPAEIFDELGRDATLSRPHKELLQGFLVHCDLVKFAVKISVTNGFEVSNIRVII